MKNKISKIILTSLCALFFSACVNDSSSSKEDTKAKTIQDLEDKGQIAVLNRSTSIKGPDTNNNNIRDDIDKYISSLNITLEQKKAVEQFARNMQDTLLVDVTNVIELRSVDKKSDLAINCLFTLFPYPNRGNMITSIESKTANTKQRAMKYILYNNALSGSVSRLSSGDTCEK